MARFMFCAIPAAIVAIVFGLLHWSLGLIAFACMFGFGWDVTTARPERGESNERFR